MQAERTIERKYALTKIRSGDWLLPGNSGQTLYRLRSYEDGRINGLEHGPWCGTYWEVLHWRRGLDTAGIADALEAEMEYGADEREKHWLQIDWMLDSRAEAIQTALRDELRRPSAPESPQ